MSLTTRKFYKLNGLDRAFKYDNVGTYAEPIIVYNTTTSGFRDDINIFNTSGIQNVDEHTIFFIIASSVDEGRYVNVGIIAPEQVLSTDYSDTYEDDYNSAEQYINEQGQKRHLLKEGDTMIWTRGNIYCVTPTNTVTKIEFDNNRDFTITYADGTEQIISPEESGFGYTATYPIVIDGDNIELKGLSIDTDNNFIENPDANYVYNGVSNSHVEGEGNVSNKSNQHIQGKFAVSDSSSIFIIGNGEDDSNRKNIFTVGYDGKLYTLTDVVCGPNKSNPDYRLSDIHSVLNEDWFFIGDRYSSYNQSFNNSYDIDENSETPLTADVYIDDILVTLNANETYYDQEITELYSQNTYPSGGQASDYLVDTTRTYPVMGEAYWTYCDEE